MMPNYRVHLATSLILSAWCTFSYRSRLNCPTGTTEHPGGNRYLHLGDTKEILHSMTCFEEAY